MAQKKFEVLVDRISLVVGKGSIVTVDERQYEIARPYLKEVRANGTKAEDPKEETAIQEAEAPKEEKKSLAQAARENKIGNKPSNKNGK